MSKADQLLRELWALWNNPAMCRMKTDYMKGHLSYANHLNELEAGLRAYLNEKPHELSTDNGFRMALNIRPLPESPPHAAAEPEKPDGWQKHLAQSDDVDADGLIRSLRELRDTRMDALEVDERKKITQAADELTMHRRASAEAEPVAWIWHGMEGRGTKTLRWRKTNTWEYAPEGETPLYASPSAQPIARDEQDAKRYRFLRVRMGEWHHDIAHATESPSTVDAAIDAALKSAGKE